jgi:hypothetical protein
MGSGPTVDTFEDIIFSGHMAALEPSTWRGRVLFTTRLEIAARAPRLHTVVRGTLSNQVPGSMGSRNGDVVRGTLQKL